MYIRFVYEKQSQLARFVADTSRDCEVFLCSVWLRVYGRPGMLSTPVGQQASRCLSARCPCHLMERGTVINLAHLPQTLDSSP